MMSLFILMTLYSNNAIVEASIDFKGAKQFVEYGQVEKIFENTLSEYSQKTARHQVEGKPFKTPANTRLISQGYEERKRKIESENAQQDYFEYDGTLKYEHISLVQHPLVMDIVIAKDSVYVLVENEEKAEQLKNDITIESTLSHNGVNSIANNQQDITYRQVSKTNIVKRNRVIFVEIETSPLDFKDLFSSIHYALRIAPQKRNMEGTSLGLNYNNGNAAASPLVFQSDLATGQITFQNTYFHTDVGIELEFTYEQQWDKTTRVSNIFSTQVLTPTISPSLKARLFGFVEFNFVAESNMKSSSSLPLTSILPPATNKFTKTLGNIDLSMSTELSASTFISADTNAFSWSYSSNYAGTFDIGFDCRARNAESKCETWSNGVNLKTPKFDSNYVNLKTATTVSMAIIPKIKLILWQTNPSKKMELGAEIKPSMTWKAVGKSSTCGLMTISTTYECSLNGYNTDETFALANIYLENNVFLKAKTYTSSLVSTTTLRTTDSCAYSASRNLPQQTSVVVSKNVACCVASQVTYSDNANEIQVVVSILNSDIQLADGFRVTTSASSMSFPVGSVNYTSSSGSATLPFVNLGSTRTVTISLYKAPGESVTFSMEFYRNEIPLSTKTSVATGGLIVQGPSTISTILAKSEGGTFSVTKGQLSNEIWTISQSDFPLDIKYSGVGYFTLYPVYQVASGSMIRLLINPSGTTNFILKVGSQPSQSMALPWSALMLATRLSSDLNYKVSGSGSLSIAEMESMVSPEVFTSGASKLFSNERPDYIYISVTNSLTLPVLFESELVDVYYLNINEDGDYSYISQKNVPFLIQVNKTQSWATSGASIRMIEDTSTAVLTNTMNVDSNPISVFNKANSLFVGKAIGDEAFGYSSTFLSEFMALKSFFIRIDNSKEVNSKGFINIHAIKSNSITCTITFEREDGKGQLEKLYLSNFYIFMCLQIDDEQYSFNKAQFTLSTLKATLKKINTLEQQGWEEIILPDLIDSLKESDKIIEGIEMASPSQLCIPLESYFGVTKPTKMTFNTVSPTLFMPPPSLAIAEGTAIIETGPAFFALAAGILAAWLTSLLVGICSLAFALLAGCLCTYFLCCYRKRKKLAPNMPN